MSNQSAFQVLLQSCILKDMERIASDGEGEPVWFNRHHAQALLDVLFDKEPYWQSIDSGPKDGSFVLLDNSRWHMRVQRGYWDAKWGAWFVHGFGQIDCQPTHWHPLPTPLGV